jgi:hypothetical protein
LSFLLYYYKNIFYSVITYEVVVCVIRELWWRVGSFACCCLWCHMTLYNDASTLGKGPDYDKFGGNIQFYLTSHMTNLTVRNVMYKQWRDEIYTNWSTLNNSGCCIIELEEYIIFSFLNCL